MKKYIGLIVWSGIISCLLSCTSDKKEVSVKIPDEVLKHGEMVKVLADFHLVESALLHKQHKLGDMQQNSMYFFSFILDKHGITQEEFNTSLKWYIYNINEYEKVYADLVAYYTQMQKDIKNY